MTVITTARTYLREFIPSDAVNVLSIFSDPRCMAFAPMSPTSDPSVADGFIRWHLDNYRCHGFSAWAVIHKGTEVFIGQAGLLPHQVGLEVFYSLLPQYWNQGLGTEIALACRDHAFNNLRATHLISMIHPRNESAIQVAQKIGMKQNGTIQMWNRDNSLFEIQRST